MTERTEKLSRGATALASALILLFAAAAAVAAVDIDPGTTASDLVAEGGNILEECTDSANETCTLVINDAQNEIGALVQVTPDGSGVASGEIFTDFNITGTGDAALVGSFLSAEVDVTGVLNSLGPNALASVKASLEVRDTTADALVGAETIRQDSITDGSIQVSELNAIAMPLPLTPGHSYRVSLILRAQAAGSSGDAAGALSDFANTASWSNLSVTAGADPFALIAALDARVTQLESDLGDLGEEVADLREDFEGHSHIYLTGRGAGHNNTEAETGALLVPENGSGDEDDAEDGDGDGVANADDQCPGTSGGAEVDASGCDLAAFCALQERVSSCSAADWHDDDPRNARDCRWRRGACEAF